MGHMPASDGAVRSGRLDLLYVRPNVLILIVLIARADGVTNFTVLHEQRGGVPREGCRGRRHGVSDGSLGARLEDEVEMWF